MRREQAGAVRAGRRAAWIVPGGTGTGLVRLWVMLMAWLLLVGGGMAQAQESGPPYPPVLPGKALVFPQDFGAHPDYRTEWWYITGWLRDAAGVERGFQLTFFRVRTRIGEVLAFAGEHQVANQHAEGENAQHHVQEAALHMGTLHSRLRRDLVQEIGL